MLDDKEQLIVADLKLR